jgi:hypothetical protein
MAAPEEEPPRKNYGFKEREFKRDNSVGRAGAPPTAKELAMLAGPVIPTPKGATGPKADDPNDVFTTLQQNRAIERQLSGDQIEIREVKSKRLRDYWIMLIGGNLFIIGGVLLVGPNVISVMFGFGGVLIFSLSLTWIVWQVMGRY